MRIFDEISEISIYKKPKNVAHQTTTPAQKPQTTSTILDMDMSDRMHPNIALWAQFTFHT